MSALVYAAKDMEIAETTIHMPVSEVVVPATTARESKDSERATLLLFSSVACASACKVFAPKSSSAARNPAVTIFPAKSALRNPAMILPLHIHSALGRQPCAVRRSYQRAAETWWTIPKKCPPTDCLTRLARGNGSRLD